eukprot:195807-Prorocentrum_minimum.AAC.1
MGPPVPITARMVAQHPKFPFPFSRRLVQLSHVLRSDGSVTRIYPCARPAPDWSVVRIYPR